MRNFTQSEQHRIRRLYEMSTDIATFCEWQYPIRHAVEWDGQEVPIELTGIFQRGLPGIGLLAGGTAVEVNAYHLIGDESNVALAKQSMDNLLQQVGQRYRIAITEEMREELQPLNEAYMEAWQEAVEYARTVSTALSTCERKAKLILHHLDENESEQVINRAREIIALEHQIGALDIRETVWLEFGINILHMQEEDVKTVNMPDLHRLTRWKRYVERVYHTFGCVPVTDDYHAMVNLLTTQVYAPHQINALLEKLWNAD